MKIQTFDIEGPRLCFLDAYSDQRGFFVERLRTSWLPEMKVLNQIDQLNFSRSEPNVLRGLHYQYDAPQGKLVTATRGRVFDVAVDIRANSPTFGQSVSVVLDGATPSWFWVPAGFAHGFLVIGNEPADVMYAVDTNYNGAGEGAIVWNDPDLAIKWPNEGPVNISGKDAAAPTFKSYLASPKFR